MARRKTSLTTVRRISDPGLDARDIEIISDITDHGWHIVGVVAEKESPGWAHSIGLFETFSHPEVLVFGLADDVLIAVVDTICQAVRDGRRFESGVSYPDLLDSVECVFKPVHRRWYPVFLGDTEWFYCEGSFPVLQCLWSDRERRLPWSEEFEPGWTELQPLLFFEDIDATRTIRLLESLEPASSSTGPDTDPSEAPAPKPRSSQDDGSGGSSDESSENSSENTGAKT